MSREFVSGGPNGPVLFQESTARQYMTLGGYFIDATVSAGGGSGKIKWWNGSAFVEKPVKYWNGSAWVAKPLKFWNGSAWVLG